VVVVVWGSFAQETSIIATAKSAVIRTIDFFIVRNTAPGKGRKIRTLPKFLPRDHFITRFHLVGSAGLGGGVGRGLAVGCSRGVGLGRGVADGVGVAVEVGVGDGVGGNVDVGVAVGVAVAVAVAVGVAVPVGVAVGVGVSVVVGEAVGVAVGPCTSNDPLSMRPFTTRSKPGPRWSKKGGGLKFGSPESIAGLPGNSSCVNVGPPLSCNGPSNGLVLIWSPGPVRTPPPSSLLRL
jgi:hypothetical protein